MVGFTSGANGTTMNFFNSINGNLTPNATSQTVTQTQVNSSNATTQIQVAFSDVISLNTNDTVQLGATCAATSNAVVLTRISCNIVSNFD